VQEAEEADGTDIITGFERLQFADGCALPNEDGSAWVQCEPSAVVTLSPLDPVEGEPVTSSVWDAADPAVPFNLAEVTNLSYTWWAGEGDAPDNITEWEVLIGASGASYTPGSESLGSYLRVTVSYTDAEGFFRSATSAPTNTPVAAGVNEPPTNLAVLSTSPITPGTQLTVQLPIDPDGIETVEGGDILAPYTFLWEYTAGDPAAADAVWVEVAATVDSPNTFTVPNAPEEVGRTYRVTVSYTDLGGTAEAPEALASGPVVAAP
jgi:hypothetical protein